MRKISNIDFEEYVKKMLLEELKESKLVNSLKKKFFELDPEKVKLLLKRKKPLSKDKALGKVFVSEVCKQGRYTVAILELSNDSEILNHRHTDDEEYYIVWRGDKTKCSLGEGHGLKNLSGTSMYVLSIKVKK